MLINLILEARRQASKYGVYSQEVASNIIAYSFKS